jgi:hypothetical protein
MNKTKQLDERFLAIGGIDEKTGRGLVAVYDTKQDKAKFGPLGQFTGARYYAQTIAGRPDGVALSLDGGIAEWTLTPDAADSFKEFAIEVAAEAATQVEALR